MLRFLLRRGFSSNPISSGGGFFRKQIIPNPPGYQAIDVASFSVSKKGQTPMAFLRENMQRAEIDVLVFVPDDDIVGVDVIYEPNTTLGRMHKDIYETYMETFVLANGMKPALWEDFEKGNVEKSHD